MPRGCLRPQVRTPSPKSCSIETVAKVLPYFLPAKRYRKQGRKQNNKRNCRLVTTVNAWYFLQTMTIKPRRIGTSSSAVSAAWLAVVLCYGCTQALPNQDLRTVGEQTRVVASSYAVETKRNADLAEEKLKRAEELLSEARQLFARADAAEKRCAERAERLGKVKPVIINKCPQPAPSPAASQTPASSSSGAAPAATPAASPTPPPSTSGSQGDPEYSPSDAPM